MDTQSENHCGTCRACCFTHSVCDDDLKQLTKLFEHCQHCTQDSGCSIYASRPEGCRVYKCLWLCGSKTMSAQLRPDNLGVVIDAHPLTNIKATLFLFWESTTDALRKPDVRQLIENIIGSGNNIILALSPGNKIGTWFKENLGEETKATQEQAVLEFWEKLHSAKREKRTRPDN